MLSFPHFYLADPKLLDAVEGISPPEADKHQLYVDVQPVITFKLLTVKIYLLSLF